MRNLEFITGEFYHIYNRGTDKRDLFLDDADNERFLESLHLFNDRYYGSPKTMMQRTLALSMSDRFDFEREHFVEICAYTLIPNHFHLFVRQGMDGGISRLMQKLEMGFSKYFNRRHDRSGTLYESPFKAVHVSNRAHFFQLPVYVHLNILDLFNFSWRSGLVDDWDKALKLMSMYKWSSHNAFMGDGQYLPIVSQGTIDGFYNSPEEYEEHLRGWSSRHLEKYLAQLS
jgi:putative transposase